MKKDPSEFKDEREDNDLYQAAFYDLIKEIDTDLLHNKRAYDMCTLLQEYKKNLEDNGVNAASYKSERLKKKLTFCYGKKIVFQKPDRSKSELVYSSSISIADAINTAARIKADTARKCLGMAFSAQASTAERPVLTLFRAAQLLQSEIKQCKNITRNEISESASSDIIPDTLYMFLKFILDTTSGEDQ